MDKSKLLLKLGIKTIQVAALMGCGSGAYLLFSPEQEPKIKEKIKTIYSWNFEDKGDRIIRGTISSDNGFKDYTEENIEAKFKLSCSGSTMNKETDSGCERRIESGAGSLNHQINLFLSKENLNKNTTTGSVFYGWDKYKFTYQEDVEPGRKEYYGYCFPYDKEELRPPNNICHRNNLPQGWTKEKLEN